MTDAELLVIEVVYALPERAWSATVRLPAPATVGQALRLSQMATMVPGLASIDAARLAVYGRAVTLDSPLHDGDRIEILRPLLVDPKQARRRRAGIRKPPP